MSYDFDPDEEERLHDRQVEANGGAIVTATSGVVLVRASDVSVA